MKVELNLVNPHTLPRVERDDISTLPMGIPFLYFLFWRGVLVYIGVTDNRLPGRLYDHRLGKNTTKKKQFDQVAFIEEHSARNRYAKEILYVFKHKPKYNAAEWGPYW